MKRQAFALLFCLWYAFSLSGSTLTPPPGSACDTVFTRDGRTLLVRTWTIRDKELEYALCEQPDKDTRGRIVLSNVLEIRCSALREKRKYKAWVHLHDATTPVTGFLLMATDSSILLSKKADVSNPGTIMELPTSQINKIKLSSRGKLGRSVAAGAAIGAGSGLILGFASGDDQEGFLTFSKEEKAIISGIMLGLMGAMIGLFVGLKKKIIYLNGSAEKYRLYRPLLNRYALRSK